MRKGAVGPKCLTHAWPLGQRRRRWPPIGGVHFYFDHHRHGVGAAGGGVAQRLAGTPDAIRYSLLWTAVVMNLISAVYFWLAGKTLVQDLEAKKRL